MSRTEGYDRVLSIFSPEGHLYQVEYAFKCVQIQGNTAVAIKGRDAVVLVTQKKVKDRLIDQSSVTSMYKIANHVGAVVVGPPPDGKSFIARARHEAAEFEYKYGYPIPTGYVAKKMADIAQEATQYAGRRPLAVTAIFAGMDEADEPPAEGGEEQSKPGLVPKLYRVDLAGSFFGYTACAAGTKEQEANSLLEKKMKERRGGAEMSEDEICQAALEVLQTCVGADFKPSEVEVAVMRAAKGGWRMLEDREVERILTAISERD